MRGARRKRFPVKRPVHLFPFGAVTTILTVFAFIFRNFSFVLISLEISLVSIWYVTIDNETFQRPNRCRRFSTRLSIYIYVPSPADK